MKISVIVTTYNRPGALKKVLEGLCNQSIIPQEVLIADDGSTSETKLLVDEYKRTAPFKLIHCWQNDQGFRAARIRNKAILASSGDYLISLDGDCIPNLWFIEDHSRLATKGFFIQGKRVLISKSLTPHFLSRDVNRTFRLLSYALNRKLRNIHHLLRIPSYPASTSTSLKGIKSCNMSFFREDIFAVNGFNEDYIGWGREDSELAVRFYHLGLYRKSHPFLAICFHLWHSENDRTRFTINDQLLENAKKSYTHTCDNGLVKIRKA